MKNLQSFTALFLLIFLPAAFCLDYFDPQSPLGGRRPEQPPSPFQLSPNSANSNRPIPQQQQSPSIYLAGSGGNNQNQHHQYSQQKMPNSQTAGSINNQQQSPFGASIGGNNNPQLQHQQTQQSGLPFGQGIGGGGGGSRQQRQQQQSDQQLASFGRGLQQQQNQRNSSGGGIGGNGNNQQNNPFGPSNPFNPHSNAQQPMAGGNVLVEVQLRSYANPSFRLPGNLLCTCPQNDFHCVQSSPQRVGWNCLTSISVFVLSADADLKFNETAYHSLNQFGQFPFELAQQPHSTFQFTLDSAPAAIALLVHNLGARIDMNGHLLDTNAVTVVDYFVHNLTGSQPGGIGGGGMGGYGGGGGGGNVGGQQGVSLQGKLQGTELTFSYAISCHGAQGPDGKPLVGPGCDLACNSSTLTGNTAVCVSQKSGYYSLCRWSSGNAQVTNCQNCPWGIKEDAYCADEQGGVLQPDHAGVVSSFYYKAFIVLAVLCALLLICFVILCLISLRSTLKSRRSTTNGYRRGRAVGGGNQRQNEAAAAAGFNNTTAPRVHRGDPEAAALNATFESATGKAPPPYQQFRQNGGGGATNSAQNGDSVHASVLAGPFPLPRSNASAASVAGSEIIGGGNAGNQRRQFPPAAILPPMIVGGGGGGKPAAGTTVAGKTLSPPRYQPLPHLGPNAGSDSLNSSFAGLPPPSVSADV